MGCDCKIKVITKQGEQGPIGPQGDPGPVGPQGEPGSGFVYDSGWKTLPAYTVGLGYGFPTGYNLLKIRIIDRVVYLEGSVILPLADGGNVLQPVSSVTDGNYVNVYSGADGGYTVNAGGVSHGTLLSNQPVLPLVLRPQNALATNQGISLIRRVMIPPGPLYKVAMTAPILNGITIRTDGTFLIHTLQYIESDNLNINYPVSSLRKIISRFDSGDKIADYTNYRDSYSGGVLQHNIAELVTPITSYAVTFDPINPLHYGAFNIYVNTRFLINNTTSLTDIQNAFNAIP